MKCISACGYSHKPDNLALLTRHVEECLARGACKILTEDPSIVWQDGEFTVAPKEKETPNKKSQTQKVFPVTFIKKEAIELTEDMVKTGADIAKAAVKGPNVILGGLNKAAMPSGGLRKNAKNEQAI